MSVAIVSYLSRYQLCDLTIDISRQMSSVKINECQQRKVKKSVNTTLHNSFATTKTMTENNNSSNSNNRAEEILKGFQV